MSSAMRGKLNDSTATARDAVRGQQALGSGPEGRPLCVVYCSNTKASNRGAALRASPALALHVTQIREEGRNAASQFCKNCRLVAYCSKECQKQHWKDHKALCTSELMQEAWADPARLADHQDDDEDDHPPPFSERLWGNVPARGVLGSASTSAPLPEKLSICFAASGDLRNLIETVCQLPEDYKGDVCTIHVNDADPKVAVRNFIMLELLRMYGEEAIDAVIAIWYSIGLTAEQLRAAKAVARKAQGWPLGEIGNSEGSRRYNCYSASCGDGGSTLVVRFEKKTSDTMKELCEHTTPLEVARLFREVVMESSSRVETENRLACLRPAHRLACHYFRQTGLLLPFGSHSTQHHRKANRFLLKPGSVICCWAMDGRDDPLYGWDMTQVLATGLRKGVPAMDIYGCLFFHLRSKLQTFVARWQSGKINVVLTDEEPSELARSLMQASERFDRIDTGSLADSCVGGVKQTLKQWGPLLKAPAVNVGSAQSFAPLLITFSGAWPMLYMLWKTALTRRPATSTATDKNEVAFAGPAMTLEEMLLARRKAELWGATRRSFFPEIVRKLKSFGGRMSWLIQFHDFSVAFDDYLEIEGALKTAAKMGLRRNKAHDTVPHRLFVPVNAAGSATPASPGNRGDVLQNVYIHCVVHHNISMAERYVEWSQTPTEI
ncbi:hypothetical protein L7F22_001274 [Adiantum nelumboides]|nr:hypothetical protein [Adiantum nelumboides]